MAADPTKTDDSKKTDPTKKTDPAKKTTDATPAEGGSGAVWWIVGILAVVGLGGGFWFYKKKQDDKEGGETDMYSRFIDQETTC